MNVNIFLFDNFETLDVFGPVEALGHVEDLQLHHCSITGGTVTSKQGTPIITTALKDADPHGILLIPGGAGTRILIHDEPAIKLMQQMADSAPFCLAVCTGSALLAKTGLLDGRKATSNKKAWDWVTSQHSKVL